MSSRTFGRALCLLAFAAGLLRVVHLVEVRDSPRWQVLIGDAGRYHAWATEIAAGNWRGTGTFYQAPLYPYGLGAVYVVTGPHAIAARCVQAALGVFACVLLACAGARFFGRGAGLLAGAILAVWPAELFHESLIEKATLGTLLTCALALALGTTLRTPRDWRGWFAAGTMLGLLALVRENALLLAPVLVAWRVWLPRLFNDRNMDNSARGRFARHLILILAGLLLPLAPVLVRNRVVGSEWRLTTAQLGPNFYIGNHHGADGTYVSLLPEHGTPAHEQRDATAIASAAAGRELSSGEVDAWWTRRTLNEIGSAPWDWCALMLQKLALTVTSVEIADSEDQYTAAEESRVLGGLTAFVSFGGLAAAAAASVVLLGRSLQRVWVLPVLVVAYVLSVALFYVFARYRLPLVPWLALLCGGGGVRFVTLLRRHRWGRVTVAGLVGAATFLVTQPGLARRVFRRWPDLSVARMQGVTQFNLGLRFWEQGAERERIESHLQESTRLHPDYASAWFYWGHVLVDFDDRAGAVAKFKRAVECDPTGADIRLELGANLLLLDRPEQALPHLQCAAEWSPSDAEAQYLYGRALYLNGRLADAAQPLQQAVALEAGLQPARRLLAITLDQLGRTTEAEAMFRELQRQLPEGAVERLWIERRWKQRRSMLSK